MIAWALTLLCASGAILAEGWGATAAANTFEVMICLGFALTLMAAFHDYIRAFVDRSSAPPEPPPATRDEPPEDSDA